MAKRRCDTLILIFLSLLFIQLLLPNPAMSVDWDRWREHAENWVSAIGTQSPDPVMATALSSVPSATKGIMIQKCNKNMQDALLELLEPALTEKRRQELNVLMDKNQAMKDALAGKPENFRRILKEIDNRSYEPNDHQKTARQKLSELERENMDDLIARLRKKAQDVADASKDDIRESSRLKTEIYGELEAGSDYIQGVRQRCSKGLKSYNRYKTENPCTAAREIEREIKALCVLTLDNETKYKRHIELARNRLANCRDKKDAVFIKSAFDDAKKTTAQIEKDVAEIHALMARAQNNFKEYETLKDTFNNMIPALYKEGTEYYRGMVSRVNKLNKRLGTHRRRFEPHYSKIADIYSQVVDARQYYLPRYPDTKKKWDDLDLMVENIKLDIQDEMDEVAHKNRMIGILRNTGDIWEEISKAQKVKLNDCVRDPDTDRIVAKADTARVNVLLDLAGNIDLPDRADACNQKKAQAPAPGTATSQTNTTPQTLATPPPGPAQPPASQPPAADSGGLFISGKSRLRSGEGATFTARDGAGQPYPSGVIWNSSVEDVFVMGADGSGVAFKAGTSTIIAHKDDMVAYFDVTVQAVVPDLLGREVTEAIGVLQGLGLNGGIPIKVSTGQTFRVAGQSVAPGTLADAGKMIVLEVEAGPGGGAADREQADDEPGSAFSTAGGEIKGDPDGSALNNAGTETRIDPGASGFSIAGGEEKPAHSNPPGGGSDPGPQAGEALNLLGTSESDCVKLESDFNAAMKLGDTVWAQSVLDRGRRCGFNAAAASRLEQHFEDRAREEERQLAEQCAAAENRFHAALGSGKLNGAESIARGMKDCPGYSEAVALLNQRRVEQKCDQYRQHFYGHLNSNRIQMAQTVLSKAQADGCRVSREAVNALSRKQEEVRREHQRQRQAEIQRNQRQQQEMMNLFNQVMQNIQTQPVSRPSSPQQPPAIGTQIPEVPQAGSQTGPQSPQPESTGTCRDVCVQERILWHSSDGRHSCCKGGRPDPKCIGVRCTKVVRCVKWEKRCD